MEKKEEITLIDAFKDFKEEKNIDRPVMMGVLKDVFMTQPAKTFGSADNFDVIINVDKGDCEIYQNLEVVETVENPNTQIALADVNKNGDDYELGETFQKGGAEGFRQKRNSEYPSESSGKNHGYRESQPI